MISIITPVWNQAHLTRRYIAQLAGFDDIELVIINNGSTDDTKDLLSRYDWIKVINNKENRGFGPANNQGVKLATSDKLVLLNNDVHIRGDFVSIFKREIKPDVIVGPQLITEPTGWNTFGKTTVSYLCGWCIGIHRQTYEMLGGFDERYVPADFEDVDLCYTAVQNGVTLKQIPVPILHIFEQSAIHLPGGREGRRELTMKHRAMFVEKWGLE